MSAEPASGVRAAGAEAAGTLAALHAKAFESPWDEAAFRGLLASPGVFALACGDPPAGVLLARAIAGEAEVLTLAVDPAQRRRGLGHALTMAAAGLAGAAGADVLWLEVAEDNAAARALYASMGFAEAGRRPRYYARPGGERVDALVLRRPLNTAPR